MTDRPQQPPPASEETVAVDQVSLVGRTLEGRYDVEELVGEGAMGRVYRARQIRLRRPVAIKVPKSEFVNDPEFLARFEREALTMARFAHENIVSVFDVAIARHKGEITYLAMEFVTGSEVDRFLRAEEENLTIAAVLDIFRQLARGLDYAHAAGVVHRDIKPANMIVTMPQRIAKIMDFGIARVDMENAFRTQGSRTMGTPAFMAPEQIRGEAPGPPADIYAFGMTLYKILARDMPFDAPTTHALLYAHLSQPPKPLAVRNPNWPAAVDAALQRALSKEAGQRPATATKLVEEISEALKDHLERPFARFFDQGTAPQGPSSGYVATAALNRADEAVRGPGTRKAAVWPYAVGIGAFLLLVVGVVAVARQNRKEPPSDRQTASGASAAAQAESHATQVMAAPTPAPASPTPRPSPTPAPSSTPEPSETPAPSPSPSPNPTEEPVRIVTTPSAIEGGPKILGTPSPMEDGPKVIGTPSRMSEDEQRNVVRTPSPMGGINLPSGPSSMDYRLVPGLSSSSSRPRPTAASTPVPTTAPPSNEADPPSETGGAATEETWGPELTGSDRGFALRVMEDVITSRLKTALERGEPSALDRPLEGVSVAQREAFKATIAKHQETHDLLSLTYRRTAAKIDAQKAVITAQIGLKGRLRGSGTRTGDLVLITPRPADLRFERRGGGWALVDFPVDLNPAP